MSARRIRAAIVNSLLVLAGIAVAAVLVEIVLRGAGAYRPVGYYLLPPHGRFHDVQTSWDVTYTTNALGLRGDELPATKPAERFRVVLVGDSFTFGMGCERGAIVQDLLQARLRADGRAVDVISVSNIGIGPVAYAALVRDVAIPLEPDLIVLNVCGNDASATVPESKPRRWIRTIAEHSHLVTLIRTFHSQVLLHGVNPIVHEGAGVLGPIPNDPGGRRASALREFQATHGTRFNNLLPAMALDPDEVSRWVLTPENGAGWKGFVEFVDQIVAACRARRIPIVLGVVPDDSAVDPSHYEVRRRFGVTLPDDLLVAPTYPFDRLVRGYAAERGVPCFDPLAAFRRVRDGLYFEADMHWTPKGNALYADELAAFLAPMLPERTRP